MLMIDIEARLFTQCVTLDIMIKFWHDHFKAFVKSVLMKHTSIKVRSEFNINAS